MLLILKQVDSPRTLADASRVCRTLQLEAERLLYREVYVGRVPHVRGLHRALTKASRRPSLIKIFRVNDNGRMTPVIPLVIELLLMLTRLEHLELDLLANHDKPAIYATVLRALAQCTFKLKSFDGWVTRDSEFAHFLRRQTCLESLYIQGLRTPAWKMPQDALPCLKYVQTYQELFAHSICAPHAITHLDLTLYGWDDPDLNGFLRVVRHQLISLKCKRSSLLVRTPIWSLMSNTINCGLMPNLRYFEVEDSSDASFLPCSDDGLMQTGRANVALETFVWSAWYNDRMYLYHDAYNKDAATSYNRLASVRPWARKILKSFSSLRRFFYVELEVEDSGLRTNFVKLFTLSSDDRLVEERKGSRDLPVWSDI